VLCLCELKGFRYNLSFVLLSIFHVITFGKCVIFPQISSPLLFILCKFSRLDIREFTSPWMSSLLQDFMEFYDEKDVPRSSGRTSSLGTKMAELDDSSPRNGLIFL
jgi:hypothetical protein